MTKIAIIGGSGLENPKILKHPKIIDIETPHGNPSSSFKTGFIEGTEVAILSRHGFHVRILDMNVLKMSFYDYVEFL